MNMGKVPGAQYTTSIPSKNVTLAAAVDTIAAKLASPPEKLDVARRSLPPLSMHHLQQQNRPSLT